MKLNKVKVLSSALAMTMTMSYVAPALATSSSVDQYKKLNSAMAKGEENAVKIKKKSLQEALETKRAELEQVHNVLNLSEKDNLVTSKTIGILSFVTAASIYGANEMLNKGVENADDKYLQMAFELGEEIKELAGEAYDGGGYGRGNSITDKLTEAQRSKILAAITRTEQKIGADEMNKMVQAVYTSSSKMGQNIFLFDSPEIDRAYKLAESKVSRLGKSRVGIVAAGLTAVVVGGLIGSANESKNEESNLVTARLKKLLDEGRVVEAQEIVDDYKVKAVTISAEIGKLQTELNKLNGRS